MKVIDVHPEELLDRELHGVLSAEQRTLLDAHLTHCEGCRMERLLRADFAAEAARAGEADMQSFVLGALQTAASIEVSGVPVVAAPSAPSNASRRRLTATLAVACVLLVAAGAAASQSAWVERMFQVTFGEATIESSRVVRHKAIANARPVEKRAIAGAPAPVSQPVDSSLARPRARFDTGMGLRAEDEGSSSAVTALPPASGLPGVSALPANGATETSPQSARRLRENSYRPVARSARITNVRSVKAIAQAVATSKPATVSNVAASQPKASSTAASGPEAHDPALVASQAAASALFEEANRARRNGHLDQAATLYENLQTEFKGSSEAKLSYALSARMWLDAGNAFAAYSAFERYLASGDRALREEAMTGRALSLARLGRQAAADAAFAELLQAYPYSSYAPLAKKRLGQD